MARQLKACLRVGKGQHNLCIYFFSAQLGASRATAQFPKPLLSTAGSTRQLTDTGRKYARVSDARCVTV